MIISEKAFAKINLFLDVLNRRQDSYHNIATVFQTVQACDQLDFFAVDHSEIVLEYSHPQPYPVTSDLVYRAASLLQEKYQITQGVRMVLQKNLPMGAGLGGGSADCAAALRGLNRFWNLGLNRSTLESLGASLGADVPFMIRGGTSLATGIGEKLEALEDLDQHQPCVLIVTPDCFVSTQKAYAGIQPSGSDRWNAYRLKIQASENLINPDNLYNKFEETVLPQFESIRKVREQLSAQGAQGVLMSGSGASVFGFFRNLEAAQRALNSLSEPIRWHWTGFFQGAQDFF